VDLKKNAPPRCSHLLFSSGSGTEIKVVMAPNYSGPLSYLLYSCVGIALCFSLSSLGFFFSRRPPHGKYSREKLPLRKQGGFTIHKPFVFSGRISHTRLFPKFHAFSYSYLMVGIPVRSFKSNWLLSVDTATSRWWNRGWLRVEPQDHLGRGGDGDGLSRKLDRFLQSQVRLRHFLMALLRE
jgi:hypothetical protein